MNLLEKHFDIAFAAPDGINKLRELILTLAMQGRLVRQDLNAPAANELLESIKAETRRLSKEGRIKKPKQLPKVETNEFPYDLPKGWKWVRIRDICHDWGQKTPDESFTYIDVGSINNRNGKVSSDVQVLEDSAAPSRARKMVQKGTVVYSTVRPYLLNIAIIDREYVPEPIASTAFAILHPYTGVSNRFIYYYLRSPTFIRYVEVQMKGVAYPAINDGNFFRGVFPLPPLLEQRRIVAKIDQLMARCDELEKLRAERDRLQVTVHRVACDRLLTAQDPDTFIQSWQFITQHFSELYSVKENVTELRKAILQLAVMGKLVPQDPQDQPANELLESLQKSRISIYKSENSNKSESKTMLRKLKTMEDVTPPFPIPATWVTVHLIECCEYLVDCHNKTAPYKESGIPIIRTTNVRDRQIRDEGMKYIDKETYEYWARRCPPQPGDIIFTREAPMGEAAIIPSGMTCCLGQRTMLIRPMHEFVNNEYLLIALTEPQLLERTSSSAIGATVKHFRVGAVEMFEIPLPPLSEQHCIVAKVDQLMTLCDTLEQQIDATTQKQTALLNAVINQI